MSQTLTTFGQALKKNYHGSIVDSLNNMSPLYALLEKNTADVSGENLQAVVALKLGRNQGVGSRAESEALPTARYIKTQKLAIPLAYSYGGIRFTGQVIKASEKSATAFANAVDLEVTGMVESMKIDTNRQFFGQGDGWLCMTASAEGGETTSTVTVDNPGTQWLDEGMPIQSLADLASDDMVADEDISHGLAESTAYTVGQITSDTTFELWNAAWTAAQYDKWSDNHYICRFGANGHEMMGLRGIIADATITGGGRRFTDATELATIYYTGDGSTAAARATYPILNATVEHNSGTNRPISEDIIQELLDSIEKKSGKKGDNKSLVMVTSYGVRKNFIDLLQADRRYVKPLDLIGGWKAIAYQAGNDEVPIVVDRHALPNEICVLDRRFLKIYRASDYDWMDKDGSMFERVTGYDSYQATMYCYQNLGCTSFKNQGSLRDITE